MVSLITEGVQVQVDTHYQGPYSNPMEHQWMFAYRVKISNGNPFPVLITGRKWFIFDSDGSYREVEGNNIVGENPTLDPGAEYMYVSGSMLHTECGSMQGYYTAKDLDSGKEFKITIPKFELFYPFRLN